MEKWKVLPREVLDFVYFLTSIVFKITNIGNRRNVTVNGTWLSARRQEQEAQLVERRDRPMLQPVGETLYDTAR